MASIPHQPEGKALMEYLTKALGLPAHLRRVELRVAVDECITVRCEWFPEVVEPEAGSAEAGWRGGLPLTARVSERGKP